jgi:hypothetical protein
MRQKRLYFRILSLLLSTWLLFSTPQAFAAPKTLPVPVYKASLEVLTSLDRHYKLSFLWFDRLALGQLSFSPEPSAPNRYRCAQWDLVCYVDGLPMESGQTRLVPRLQQHLA